MTTTLTTHIWIDGEECTADIQYRMDELDPTENWGRHGEKVVVIESIELVASKRLEQFLVDKIEMERAASREDYLAEQWHTNWSRRYG